MLGFAPVSWIAAELRDHPLPTSLWCPESATHARLCASVVDSDRTERPGGARTACGTRTASLL
eukprot:5298890-Pyramimonas_sp.AAC.1